MNIFIKKSVASEITKSLKSTKDKLEQLKNEVIAILKKKEDQDIKKAIEYLESTENHYTHLEKSLDGKWIEKAGYGVGTVRIWKGKKYKKVSASPTRWVRVFDKNDRGAATSMGRYIAQVKKCQSVEELYNFCMKQRSLFQDENGVDLPIMDKLRAAIDEQSGKLEGSGNIKDDSKADKRKDLHDVTIDDYSFQKVGGKWLVRDENDGLIGGAKFNSKNEAVEWAKRNILKREFYDDRYKSKTERGEINTNNSADKNYIKNSENKELKDKVNAAIKKYGATGQNLMNVLYNKDTELYNELDKMGTVNAKQFIMQTNADNGIKTNSENNEPEKFKNDLVNEIMSERNPYIYDKTPFNEKEFFERLKKEKTLYTQSGGDFSKDGILDMVDLAYSLVALDYDFVKDEKDRNRYIRNGVKSRVLPLVASEKNLEILKNYVRNNKYDADLEARLRKQNLYDIFKDVYEGSSDSESKSTQKVNAEKKEHTITTNMGYKTTESELKQMIARKEEELKEDEMVYKDMLKEKGESSKYTKNAKNNLETDKKDLQRWNNWLEAMKDGDIKESDFDADGNKKDVSKMSKDNKKEDMIYKIKKLGSENNEPITYQYLNSLSDNELEKIYNEYKNKFDKKETVKETYWIKDSKGNRLTNESAKKRILNSLNEMDKIHSKMDSMETADKVAAQKDIRMLGNDIENLISKLNPDDSNEMETERQKYIEKLLNDKENKKESELNISDSEINSITDVDYLKELQKKVVKENNRLHSEKKYDLSNDMARRAASIFQRIKQLESESEKHQNRGD